MTVVDQAPGVRAAARIRCPRCTAPMQPLRLSSHKREPVTVDHCADCRLVWFDALESVQLDALGWVRLLRTMEAAAGRMLPAAAVARPACPACREPLKTVQNRTRFGLFAALECPARHGHLHGHSGMLAERGLVRPLGAAERRALAQEKHPLHCLNCGGPASSGDDECRWCGTALVVIDLPRLAHSLRVRNDAMGPSPGARGQHVAWACRGCGAALDPGRETRCGHCEHLVVAHQLPDIDPLLDAAEAELAVAAAAAAKVRARFPSSRGARPAGARAPPPRRVPAGALARRLMLGGWLPLVVLLVAALASALAVVTGPPLGPQSALEELRARPIGINPGAAWVWVAAHRNLAPRDAAGQRNLRGGVLAMHLQQLSGGRWPFDTTLGSLIDGKPVQLPGSLTGESPWQRVLARALHPVAPVTEETPFPPELAGRADRFSPDAPGVWVERDQRSEAIWAPMVENRGPIALPLRALELDLQITFLDRVPWQCVPAAGGEAMLEPARQLRLHCRTRVAPSAQPELFASAMDALRRGETLRTRWLDRSFERAGAERLAERLIAEAALAPRFEPGPSFVQRWAGVPPARRAALVPAALIAAFVVFCAVARSLGERRAFLVWTLLSAVPSYLLGRGEGAASVLLVGMCLVVAVLIALAFSFGYRLYRDFIFRRYA